MKFDFVDLLKSYGVKAIAGLSGWKAWLANLILNKVYKALKIAAMRIYNFLITSKEIKDELKKYDEIINKPNSTEEEIRDAGRDFIK